MNEGGLIFWTGYGEYKLLYSPKRQRTESRDLIKNKRAKILLEKMN